MNRRWQANKIGLINFWYYDEQEFPFVKGRMLLRGSNGSGKSVTMQSVVPLLLDGNMSPDEIKVGLEFAELIYVYAVGKMDKDAILEALEAKNYYKDRIIEYSKENHIKSLQQYIEINSQISELERDALTGFKTRKAYYKDIAIIECDEEMCNQPVGIAFADVNGLKKSMTIWDMKQEMSCSQQLRKKS